MEWTFENFKADLEHLSLEVQKKALEIAEKLVKKEGISQSEAIQKAIIQAEEWFFDSEG